MMIDVNTLNTVYKSSDFRRELQILIDGEASLAIKNKIQSIADGIISRNTETTRKLFGKLDALFSVNQEVNSSNVKELALELFNFSQKKAISNEVFNVKSPPGIQLVAGASTNAPYTLLDPENLGRNLREIMGYCEVFNNPIRDLIPLSFERQTLHNICRELTLNYQIEMSDLPHLAHEVCEEMAKNIENYIIKLKANRTQIENKCIDYLQNGGEISDEMIDTIERLKAEIKESIDIDDPNQVKIIANRAADLICKSLLSEKVRDTLSGLTSMQQLHRRAEQENADRKVFIINGGISSGKGTAEKQIADKAQKDGIDWKDVAILNTDAFKAVLFDKSKLKPHERYYFSALAHDEASLIRNEIFMEYTKKLEQAKAPHLLIDQVWPAQDIFELGNHANMPNGVAVTLVHNPIKRSFKMAYRRGEQTDRYETAAGILSTHRGIPNQLATTLENFMTKDLRNAHVTIVANVAFGVTEPVAEMGCQTKDLTIHNASYFKAFWEKSALQLSANSFDTLYSPDYKVKGKELSDKIVALFKQ
jgi:hypothetical protein